MIAGFWEALGVLVLIIVALLGASWKFTRTAEDNRRKYQSDSTELRSTIIGSDLVPQIVSLVERIESERASQRSLVKVDEILGRIAFSESINLMAKAGGRITEIESVYMRIVKRSFILSYDLLVAAGAPVLTVIWAWLFTGSWDPQSVVLVTVIAFYGVLMSGKSIYDVIRYMSEVQRFIVLNDETRLGRSES